MGKNTMEPNYLCQAEMRDPMTSVFSYLANPSRLRQASTWTIMCFSHAIYLEVPLCVPYTTTRKYISCREYDDEDLTNAASSVSLSTSRKSPGSDLDRRVAPVTIKYVENAQGVKLVSRFVTLHLERLRELKMAPEVSSKGTLAAFHHVRLAGLENLKKLPSLFLTKNRVQAVTFENLPRLDAMPSGALGKCPYLENVEFIGAFPRMGGFGSYFSIECPGLKEVNFHVSEPKTIREVSDDGEATVERQVAVPMFPALVSIDRGFLEQTGIRQFEIPNGELVFPSLQQIHDSFLEACPALTSVALVNFPELAKIRNGFLESCDELKSVLVTDLPKLRRVGSNWMSSCGHLREVTIENLPLLKRVDQDWLNAAKRLRVFTLRDLPSLEQVDHRFLAHCSRLEHATFENLPKWRSVGDFWLSECENLSKLTLRGLPKLREFTQVNDYQKNENYDASFLHKSPVSSIKFEVDEESCHEELIRILNGIRKSHTRHNASCCILS